MAAMDDEEVRLRSAALQNAQSILTARRRAEDALHKQSAWLRVTLASIGDAVISTDAEGRVTFLNGVAEALTGWPQAEAVGRLLPDVFHIVNEYTRQAAENPALRALREGTVVGLANHTVLVARDGTERPIDDSAAPIRDESGATAGAILVFRDVTERRRAEDELRRKEAELSDFVESASVGMHWVGPDGTILWANRAELELLGYAKEEYVGRHIAEFHVDRAVIDDILCRVLNKEVLRDYEARMRCKDGSIKHVLINSSGLWEGERFVHTRCFTHDITDRKRAAEAQARLAAIVESSEDAIVSKTLDGIITSWNQGAERLFGYKAEEAVGRPITLIIPPERHGEEPAILARLRRGERVDHFETVRISKDGRRLDISLTISPVRNSTGQIIGAAKIARDITERKRVEQALREQEQRTRAILESINDAFCTFDRDWRFSYVNRKAEVLLGRSRDDLIGRNHWEEYPDTLGTDVERNYRRAVAENVTVRFETFYLPHDRWYELCAYPSPDGLSVCFRDVSDRRLAEAALRDSEHRFRQLADAMPQIVWTARPDGTIDYLNHRWTDFTGLPQTAGNEGWGQILHPDDVAPSGERWTASVESGAPFEMELRLLDGRRQSYRWHLIRTVAVLDETGKVARWYGTSTDIHAQKRAEESARYLAAASAELAGVVDYESTLQKVANLAVPFFADWSAADLAHDGTLLRLAVAHQDPDKIALVRELTREYPPDPNSQVGAYAVLRTGKPEIISHIPDDLLVQGAKDERHLRLIRALGLKSYICVPLVVSGKTLGLLTFATAESGREYTDADLGLAVDLAHRAAVAVENAQLYQALREADRRKDEFLATLAHELRNPLAPVRNALQILKMPRVDAHTAERLRDMMERQLQHLVRLVDDLLDVSRVMRGKIELRRVPVELATVVARGVETVQPLVEAQAHELSVRMPSDSLLLDADPVRLAQVVGNLLANAAKYTEPGGRILLTAERDGDRAVLRVQDNGIGIAPQMLPRIFELFVQVDHAATRSQGGLGIGLTLVKNLVEMHNGTVEARSAGLGKGSEFVVRLPISTQRLAPDHGREVGQQDHQPPSASGYRLLVVDDNQDAANTLTMLLRLQGHEVRVAYSGMAALEMTKTCTPDVIFMDIGMPGMDGYEAARRIREQPALGKVVIAALTGWGQQEDRRRTAEAGFNHHLVKPPEPKDIERVLEGIKRRNE